jgi:cytochrome c oxidase assembly factor CtaG
VDPYRWSWNPEALVLVPALAAGYGLLVRRVGVPRWRVASFALGLALLLAVTVTPLETLALHYLLSVHLLQNVVLAEWAPALLVLGLPPAAGAVVGSVTLLRVATHPLVALPVWLVNYIVWHLPWVYDAALRNPHSLLHLEHALYFLTGVALWWSVFHAEPHALGSGARAGYVWAAFVLGSPIGLLLALVPEPLYGFYASAPRLWGLTRLEDQQLGGIGMAAEQATVFFAVFAWAFLGFVREQEAQEEPLPGAER